MKNDEHQTILPGTVIELLVGRKGTIEHEISALYEKIASHKSELDQIDQFLMLGEIFGTQLQADNHVRSTNTQESVSQERPGTKYAIFLQVLKEEYGGKAKASELKSSLSRYPEFSGIDQVKSNLFDRTVGTLKDQGKIASVKFNKVNVLTWWVVRDGIDMVNGSPRLKKEYYPSDPKVTPSTPYEVNHNMG